MKKFYLQRNEDLSGVSGIGIVAEGVEFSDGTAVIRWLGDKSSTGVYASVRELVRIHGHEGKTVIVWAKDKKAAKRKDKNWKEIIEGIDFEIPSFRPQSSPSPSPYINPPKSPYRQPFQELWPGAEKYID